MAEFDEFGSDYRSRLERTLHGVGSVDSALSSKLEVLRRIADKHREGDEYRILDFGCGTGLLMNALGSISHSSFGVDVSLESLRHSVGDGGRSVLFDGRSLPFRTGSFDLVVAACVFHHITASLRPVVLEEITRILVSGGIFAIFEHNPWNPVTRWVVNRCEFDKDAELLTLRACRDMMGKSGLESFMSGYFYTVPPVNRLFAFVDSKLSQLPLGAQYYCAYRKQLGG